MSLDMEKEFKKFAKEKDFCVKLVDGVGCGYAMSDPWYELHGGGINIGITRVFSKALAIIEFYESGIRCDLVSDESNKEVKNLCKEFSEKTGFGAIISGPPTSFVDQYSSWVCELLDRELKKGYQELDIRSFLKEKMQEKIVETDQEQLVEEIRDLLRQADEKLAQL